MNVIYRALRIASLVTLGASQLFGQSHTRGDWHGVLATPAGPMMLLVQLRDTIGGLLTGDLESVSQAPGQKIPLSKVTVSANKLTFAIAAISATYDGEWHEAEQVWSGTFRQGMTLPLRLERGAPPAKKIVDGLDGTWRGSLQRESVRLRLILHVLTTAGGTVTTLDSPDMNAAGLAVERFERTGDTVRFRVPAAQVEFVGTLGDGRRSFRGTWTRPGQPSAPVTFELDSVARTAKARTQLPITIKGYHAEDVVITNPSARGVTLAGTVTIPDGRGPFPAAVLISGSGAQDRDENVFGHRPFAVLADHLSRHGIAVLRYDDRGFAGSTGDFAGATSADFATDANAAVGYLLTRADIDHKAIGLIGHSEGGMIGPISAASNERVAFVVLLAGPGTNTDQLLLSQQRLIGAAQGESETQLQRAEPIVRDILRAVRSARDSQHAAAEVRARLTNDALVTLGAGEAQRDAIVNQYSSAWMRYFLAYAPAAILARLTVPVLALNGSLDRQVPSAENLAALRVALAKNTDATVRELPGLNHMFQTAGTGALGEYDDIAETFAPGAMDVVTGWVLARFAKRDSARE